MAIETGDPCGPAGTVAFCALPLEAFRVTGPAALRRDTAGKSAEGDSRIYYMFVLELYYKMSLLLAATGFKEANHAGYESLDDALRCTYQKMLQEGRYGEEFVTLFRDVAGKFLSATPLLLAPRVLPANGGSRGFADLEGALEFSLRIADTMFHMACFGSVDAFASSGYMPARYARDFRYRASLAVLLDYYYERLESLMKMGC